MHTVICIHIIQKYVCRNTKHTSKFSSLFTREWGLRDFVSNFIRIPHKLLQQQFILQNVYYILIYNIYKYIINVLNIILQNV